ncbi:OLC1v1009179C1 [Oldenlandia corymbosa var. corymbosa]|uniref:OLC1v1009179C1 n=1 Tax=Oldenlandia corymbosa var. corymbosa TaxID=529605 RepID=A0AAV1DRI4_OLDCO|nr:OLC1v1009179C1 [Oldenlandia corymbosa var. corymbosa]
MGSSPPPPLPGPALLASSFRKIVADAIKSHPDMADFLTNLYFKNENSQYSSRTDHRSFSSSQPKNQLESQIVLPTMPNNNPTSSMHSSWTFHSAPAGGIWSRNQPESDQYCKCMEKTLVEGPIMPSMRTCPVHETSYEISNLSRLLTASPISPSPPVVHGDDVICRMCDSVPSDHQNAGGFVFVPLNSNNQEGLNSQSLESSSLLHGQRIQSIQTMTSPIVATTPVIPNDADKLQQFVKQFEALIHVDLELMDSDNDDLEISPSTIPSTYDNGPTIYHTASGRNNSTGVNDENVDEEELGTNQEVSPKPNDELMIGDDDEFLDWINWPDDQFMMDSTRDIY